MYYPALVIRANGSSFMSIGEDGCGTTFSVAFVKDACVPYEFDGEVFMVTERVYEHLQNYEMGDEEEQSDFEVTWQPDESRFQRTALFGSEAAADAFCKKNRIGNYQLCFYGWN